MGILIVIVLLALSGWTLFALFQSLRRQHAKSGSWVAFGILLACGVALGIWCAFYSEYCVGTRYRIGSSAAFTNVVTIAALATLPLRLVSWLQHIHGSREPESGRAA